MATEPTYDPMEMERVIDQRVRERLKALGAEDEKWWMWKAIGYATVIVLIGSTVGVGWIWIAGQL